MAEDIEIGADASQAIAEMRKLESAVLKSMQAAGASQKELNNISRGLERTFASVASAAVASSQKVNSGLKSEVQSTQAAIDAAQKLARAREQASAKTGLAQNAKGQVYDTTTGRFASKDQSARYNTEIALQQRLIDAEARLDRMRAMNAQNQFARDQREVQSSATVTAAYQQRQAVLERAFRSSIVGIANPDATKLQQFANVLRQIPPATWEQKMRSGAASIMEMSNSTRYALYEVASSATIAGAAFVAFGALSINAAVAHERAFANVERTTQTTAEGYRVLQRQLEVLGMELPITYEELTNIATAAGQLGIGASGIAAFTRTVAQLTATTNLTSDAAGIALARFRTFFSEADNPALAVSEASFSNLASSILKVGVNSIASESGIVNVAVQIASMGDYAGLTANQVIGLAGALSSIGVAPELARGTITRTFTLIGNAVSSGGVQLEKFAALSGHSAAEFSKAWGTEDFAGVFTDLMAGIEGIALNGGDANLALQELGFNSVRDRPLLLRLAGAADEAGVAGGLLAQTLSDAYEGWVKNSELALQYSKISSTTSARIQVLGQAFEQLAASMGEQSGSFLGDMAVQLTAIVRGFEAFSQTDAGQVLGTIAVQGSLAVGALLLIVGGAARVTASLQAVGTAYQAMQAKGVTASTALSVAFRGLSAAMGVIGIVAALASIVGGFIAVNDAARKASLGVQDVGGLVAAMKTDAEAGAEGMSFYAEANAKAAAEQKNAAATAQGMTDALYDISSSALQGASGMDSLAESTDKARYVFGNAAKEFYKSQLLQSESFQKLFDPSKQFSSSEMNNFFGQGFTLKQLGITPDTLDWDGLIEDSIKGGVNSEKVYRDLLKKLDIQEFTKADADGNRQLTTRAAAVRAYAEQIGQVFGDTGSAVQGEINSMSALQGQAKDTFQEIYDGASEGAGAITDLDEVTQKMVDGIAKGFAKFADVGSLIKLTQQLAGVSLADDPTAAAAEFEKSWQDAYGGASFSLEQYMSVFERAGGEQKSFIEDLSVLRERASNLGIDPAFLNDLAAMGPEANRLVEALVSGTDDQLVQFENLWGQTGYDSMILFATQAAIGQEVVNNVLRNAGLDGLRTFNDALASGVGVTNALAQLQLDVNGNPIVPAVGPPENLTAWEKQQWENNNRLKTTATVTVGRLRGEVFAKDGFASGGYTGNGTKYQPAGVVHAGEFVMNAEATRAIGVNNLYSMMRSASSGRAVPRGRGYAQGGLVSGGAALGATGYIESFGPLAVQQLMSAFRQYIILDGKTISDSSASQYANDSAIGAY